MRAENDVEGQAERLGQPFQQRKRWGGAASLEAGNAGLAHPGPLGQLALGPAQFLAPQLDSLGKFVTQPGLLIFGR